MLEALSLPFAPVKKQRLVSNCRQKHKIRLIYLLLWHIGKREITVTFKPENPGIPGSPLSPF